MLCLLCNDEIYQGDELKCTACKEFLHFSCASLREASFRKMGKATKDNWCCVNCKSATVCNTALNKNVNSSDESNEPLTCLTESVKFMSAQFDSFSKQLSEVLNTIKELKEENKCLIMENSKINNIVKILSRKVNLLEQKAVSNNVEIIGVPESPNESCMEIVKNIADKLGVNLSVNKAYRMYSKILNKPKKIIAVLDSVDNKNKIMENMKIKKLNANNFNINWGNGKIFINHELSPYNRDLFYKVRIFAKNNDFKFTWYNDFKIFIKKNENCKANIIFAETDLTKLQ